MQFVAPHLANNSVSQLPVCQMNSKLVFGLVVIASFGTIFAVHYQREQERAQMRRRVLRELAEFRSKNNNYSRFNLIESLTMDQGFSLENQWKKYSRLTLPCHKSTIHSVRWSPDGCYLASGGKDKMVHLHRATESDLVLETRYSNSGHTADIDQLCWNPAEIHILATASMDRQVKIWDIRYIDPVSSIKLKNENITVNWSNDGLIIAVADRADVVSFIDLRMGHKVYKDHKFAFEVGEITWNKENDLFFVTSGDGKIHVLNYPDLHTLLVIDAFVSPCVCIRFSPSGKQFAVGSNDAISSIWDSENLACTVAIERLEWPIKTVSFSYDGKYLASGSEDHFIDIANARTGEQITAIDVNSPTLTLDFHPKEHILAYALDEREYRDVGTIKVVGFPEKERRRNQL